MSRRPNWGDKEKALGEKGKRGGNRRKAEG